MHCPSLFLDCYSALQQRSPGRIFVGLIRNRHLLSVVAIRIVTLSEVLNREHSL